MLSMFNIWFLIVFWWGIAIKHGWVIYLCHLYLAEFVLIESLMFREMLDQNYRWLFGGYTCCVNINGNISCKIEIRRNTCQILLLDNQAGLKALPNP
jgi:hypothetical protein